MNFDIHWYSCSVESWKREIHLDESNVCMLLLLLPLNLSVGSFCRHCTPPSPYTHQNIQKKQRVSWSFIYKSNIKSELDICKVKFAEYLLIRLSSIPTLFGRQPDVKYTYIHLISRGLTPTPHRQERKKENTIELAAQSVQYLKNQT